MRCVSVLCSCSRESRAFWCWTPVMGHLPSWQASTAQRGTRAGVSCWGISSAPSTGRKSSALLLHFSITVHDADSCWYTWPGACLRICACCYLSDSFRSSQPALPEAVLRHLTCACLLLIDCACPLLSHCYPRKGSTSSASIPRKSCLQLPA